MFPSPSLPPFSFPYTISVLLLIVPLLLHRLLSLLIPSTPFLFFTFFLLSFSIGLFFSHYLSLSCISSRSCYHCPRLFRPFRLLCSFLRPSFYSPLRPPLFFLFLNFNIFVLDAFSFIFLFGSILSFSLPPRIRSRRP